MINNSYSRTNVNNARAVVRRPGQNIYCVNTEEEYDNTRQIYGDERMKERNTKGNCGRTAGNLQSVEDDMHPVAGS